MVEFCGGTEAGRVEVGIRAEDRLAEVGIRTEGGLAEVGIRVETGNGEFGCRGEAGIAEVDFLAEAGIAEVGCRFEVSRYESDVLAEDSLSEVVGISENGTHAEDGLAEVGIDAETSFCEIGAIWEPDTTEIEIFRIKFPLQNYFKIFRLLVAWIVENTEAVAFIFFVEFFAFAGCAHPYFAVTNERVGLDHFRCLWCSHSWNSPNVLSFITARLLKPDR